MHGSFVLDAEEREHMRVAGRFNAQLMDFVRPYVQPGVTTAELDRMVHEYTLDHGHVPACLGYQGYPNTICTSINNVVCHGIPGPQELLPGDIINVDLTTIVHGWHGDQSETFLLEPVAPQTRALVQCAFDCLWLGIDAIKPYGRIIEIGKAIRKHAEPLGFSVVRDYQGHGLGRLIHQEPSIPHYPERSLFTASIRPGICFTIEPMINAGSYHCELDRRDGWTVRTQDGRLSAQFEHTLLMTEHGVEVLTTTEHGPHRGHRF